MRWENEAVGFVAAWRSFALVAGVSLLGILLGIVVGLFAFRPAGVLSAAEEERYYVLASKLYAQGESLDSMKAYLSAAGSRDIASTVERLASKYEQSGDGAKRAEAADLRQMAEALRTSPGVLSSVGRAPTPSDVRLASQSPVNPDAPLSAQPVSTPALPQAVTTPAPEPTPTTSSIRQSTTGVAQPAGGGGAVLREQPSTKSKAVAGIPNGEKVEILEIVQGEAIDPVEPRWYHIRFGEKTGYVYFKLIVPQE